MCDLLGLTKSTSALYPTQEEDIQQDDAWVVISAFFEEKVSRMVA
jgi:hypothetical protein